MNLYFTITAKQTDNLCNASVIESGQFVFVNKLTSVFYASV